MRCEEFDNIKIKTVESFASKNNNQFWKQALLQVQSPLDLWKDTLTYVRTCSSGVIK